MAFDLSDEMNYKVTVEAICPSGFGDHANTKQLEKLGLDTKIQKRINTYKKPQGIVLAALRTIIANHPSGNENDWDMEKYTISDDKNSIYIHFKNMHTNAKMFYNIYKIMVKVTCIK